MNTFFYQTLTYGDNASQICQRIWLDMDLLRMRKSAGQNSNPNPIIERYVLSFNQ